jgi:hypothetical protein
MATTHSGGQVSRRTSISPACSLGVRWYVIDSCVGFSLLFLAGFLPRVAQAQEDALRAARVERIRHPGLGDAYAIRVANMASMFATLGPELTQICARAARGRQLWLRHALPPQTYSCVRRPDSDHFTQSVLELRRPLESEPPLAVARALRRCEHQMTCHGFRTHKQGAHDLPLSHRLHDKTMLNKP